MSSREFDHVVDYEPEKHEYTVDGVVWPSVSKILRPLVDAEYAGARADDMHRASLMGTYLALAIELDIAGTLNEDDLDPRLRPRFESYKRFRRESGFEPMLCESIVVSKRYRYCGRLDMFGTLPRGKKRRKLALIDAKATCSIVRTVRPQTAGYAIALASRLPGAHVDAIYATRTEAARRGPFTEHEIERYALHLPEPPAPWRLKLLDDPNDFRVFLARATLFHHWEKP